MGSSVDNYNKGDDVNREGLAILQFQIALFRYEDADSRASLLIIMNHLELFSERILKAFLCWREVHKKQRFPLVISTILPVVIVCRIDLVRQVERKHPFLFRYKRNKGFHLLPLKSYLL